MNPKIFMLIGPSGAGKTTLSGAMVRRSKMRSLITLVCSYTTRPPRPGELDGIDYHFIAQDDFLKMLQADIFLEYSTAYTFYYGFSRDDIMQILRRGLSVMLVIDRAGARSILRQFPEAVIINIVPPSLTILRERLCKRSGNVVLDNDFRLKKAAEELAEEETDKLADHIIVNDDLELALKDLEQLVFAQLKG